MIWEGEGTAYGEEKNVIEGFGGKTGRKRPLVRPTHIYIYIYMEDNIKIDF